MSMDRMKRFLSRHPGLPFHTSNINASSSNTQEVTPNLLDNLPPPRPPFSSNPPRILIIGGGSRGASSAQSIIMATNGVVGAIAEPIEFKRKQFGMNYIWGVGEPQEGMEFEGWVEFKEWELKRREKKLNGEQVPDGVDGVFVCTLDHTHVAIITGLSPLNLHILSEKPLATTLEDCLRIYKSLTPKDPTNSPTALFAVAHVLRYSPRHVLLRKLLHEDEAIGDVISIEHTEPIGWWHFSHSYVR